MKKIFYFVLVALAALTLASCDKKASEGLTRVTYYPELELKGDNPYVIRVGGSFTEPGFVATLNGEDISSTVTTSTNLDAKTPGIYSVTYKAVNPDGFMATVSRDVYVLNPGHIDNVYSSSARMGSRSYKNLPIVISKISDGVYELEDLCGGYYCYGRYPGYEPSYDFHAEVVFSINDDGSFNLLTIGDWQFVDSFNYENITGGYNAETGVFDYDFDDLLVTLTPME